MAPEVIITIVLTAFSLFLVCAVIGTIYYEIKSRRYRLTKLDKNDWLFNDFHKTVFSLIYGKSKSETLAGINKEEYLRKCKIIHKRPQYEEMVAMRIEGILCFGTFLVLGYGFSYSILARIACMTIGAILFYALWILPMQKFNSDVDNKLFYVKDDLPRFLSLLEKALDLPIDQAMVTTASKFDSPLSEDLIDSINKVSLGANGWQETLQDLARTYDIEDFSDLVLEIISSYEQGVNIRPLINRKAYEVEQNRMYAVEAHDAKIKTLITLPILVFKVIPLMVLVILPMLGDMMQ